MLLQNSALTMKTRAHFGLTRNPFVDDMQSSDDVYQSADVREARAFLMDCAMSHGFLAVVGESGAGKSTLAEDLEERIRAEKRDVLIIRPYVLAMEASDTKGKTLRSTHIAEAVVHALDPDAKVRSSPQARFTQLHELLRHSHRAGRRHLLLIEEAHCLPLATMKHLKRFLELKDGMRRLVGVALIGQPELRVRLANGAADVREVTQRCQVVPIGPMSGEVEGYLRHKFSRLGVALDKVVAPDAVGAIVARLKHMPRGGKPADAIDICYPLTINNLMCRAMNAAADEGWPIVDAQVIAGC
ncbi:MAG: AAA family ATPase [Acidovorax sp.]|nr:AAA family ATPase [Acidovorax sp.]